MKQETIKEARLLLKKARAAMLTVYPEDDVYKCIDKALGLLKPCKACGGSKKVMIEGTERCAGCQELYPCHSDCPCGTYWKTKPCPDCKPESEPADHPLCPDCGWHHYRPGKCQQSQEPASGQSEKRPPYKKIEGKTIEVTEDCHLTMSEVLESIYENWRESKRAGCVNQGTYEGWASFYLKKAGALNKVVCDRLEAETKALKSKQACYDTYKAIAEKKVVEMATNLKTAEDEGEFQRQRAFDANVKLKARSIALLRYAEHETGCMKGDACNCGLRQALKES